MWFSGGEGGGDGIEVWDLCGKISRLLFSGYCNPSRHHTYLLVPHESMIRGFVRKNVLMGVSPLYISIITAPPGSRGCELSSLSSRPLMNRRRKKERRKNPILHAKRDDNASLLSWSRFQKLWKNAQQSPPSPKPQYPLRVIIHHICNRHRGYHFE